MTLARQSYRQKRGRAIVMAVLLLAVILRGLIPAGMMLVPSSAQSGAFQITICSAGASHQVVLPGLTEPDTGQQPQVPTGKDHQLCGFAVTASALLPPFGALSQPAYVKLGFLNSPRIVDLVIVTPSVGPQLGSRAPPRLV